MARVQAIEQKKLEYLAINNINDPFPQWQKLLYEQWDRYIENM